MKKTKSTSIIILFHLAIILNFAITSCSEKGVKIDTTPKDLYEKMVNNPAFKENAMGESFCWNARVRMDQYVENYLLIRDTDWLDAGIKYYDFLIGKRDTDPDGYKGWIGPIGPSKKYWADALVGDAILLTSILDFSVLVLEDETLKNKYELKANSYVEIAKKDFAEKFDKRGSWQECGPYGSYVGVGTFIKKDTLKEWVKNPRPDISDPFNKQMDAAQVFLRLYRITGEKFYWDRAEKIFFTAKSRFQYFNNHYCWNYWEPLTPGDVDLKNKTTRHWVGVHPYRSGYQAGEVEKIVEAYHYGMVFDELDIQRIINTNLNVMWNKDKVNPRFINSNGLGADNDTSGLGAFRATYGHSNAAKNSGELWTGLLDFDQTICDLYELRFKEEEKSIGRIRYENTIHSNTSGFKRKYARGEVTVPVVNFTECKDLYLAAVLPPIITKGEKSIIVCKSWKSGELEIDTYSADGKKIKNFFKGKIGGTEDIGGGIFLITWDGTDPDKKETYKGDYRIRWTIEDGYREFPITVK